MRKFQKAQTMKVMARAKGMRERISRRRVSMEVLLFPLPGN